MIKLIEKILKRNLKYNIENTAVNEIPHQKLDWQKVKKAVGWEPKYRLAMTLPGIFKWYKTYAVMPN
jgi:nucleoside-diphosphate-sugar epimerase